MSKLFAFLFSMLLLSTSAKAEGGAAEVLNLNLERKQEYVYPKKVVTAYFVGKELGEINIKPDNTLVFTPRGNAKVQVINFDGSITTLNIKSINPNEQLAVKKSKKGYYFRYRYHYEEKDYENPLVQDYDFYSHNILLRTRVGAEDGLLFTYNHQKNRRDSFFLRYDYEPRWHVGVGDSPFLFNDYRISRLSLPTLRQGILGYDYGNWEWEAFAGQQSDSYYLKDQPLPDRPLINGFRTSYNLSSDLELFFANANNTETNVHLNYLGLKKRFGTSHVVTGTYGGTEDRQNFAWKYNYQKSAKEWTLQRADISHEYSGKGLDSIYSSTDRPFERVQVRGDFYNPEFAEQGTVFVSPNFKYMLDNYDRYYEAGSDFGWKNRRVRIFNDIRKSYRVNDQTKAEVDLYYLRPGLTFYLLDNKTETLDLTFSQFQQSSSYRNTGIVYSTERSEIAADYKRGIMFYSGRVFRSAYDNLQGNQVAGYGYGAKIGLRKDRYQIYVGNNEEWLDKQFVASQASDYELARSVFSAGASAKINRNHLLAMTYSKTNNTVRDNDLFKLTYTFEFGDDKRSLPEVISPASASASVYQDLNFNGVQDGNEPTIEGLKFFLAAKDTSLEETGGQAKFSRLERKLYTLSVDADNYVLDRNNINIDLTSNYSSFSTSIAAYPKRTVVFSVESKDEVVINTVVTCGPRAFNFMLKSGNNLLDLPSNASCVAALDPSSAAGSYGFSDNNIELQDKNSISVLKNKAIQGRIYRDRNKNSDIDPGEGFSTMMVFSGQKVFSDKLGYFQFDPDNAEVDFKFEKTNCSIRPRPARLSDVISSKRTLIIRCLEP